MIARVTCFLAIWAAIIQGPWFIWPCHFARCFARKQFVMSWCLQWLLFQCISFNIGYLLTIFKMSESFSSLCGCWHQVFTHCFGRRCWNGCVWLTDMPYTRQVFCACEIEIANPECFPFRRLSYEHFYHAHYPLTFPRGEIYTGLSLTNVETIPCLFFLPPKTFS
jgi:hypothetical protein